MSGFTKYLLDWLWGKLFPIVVQYFKDLAKKAKINREVNKETIEIEEIKKKIKQYQDKHGTKEIPPHLKEALLRASRRRVRGL